MCALHVCLMYAYMYLLHPGVLYLRYMCPLCVPLDALTNLMLSRTLVFALDVPAVCAPYCAPYMFVKADTRNILPGRFLTCAP